MHTHTHPHKPTLMYLYLYTHRRTHAHTHTLCSACHPALTLKFSWIAFKGCQHHHGSRQVAAFRRRVCLCVCLCVCVCLCSIHTALLLHCICVHHWCLTLDWIIYSQQTKPVLLLFQHCKRKRTAGLVIVFFRGQIWLCFISSCGPHQQPWHHTHTRSHTHTHMHAETHTHIHRNQKTQN